MEQAALLILFVKRSRSGCSEVGLVAKSWGKMGGQVGVRICVAVCQMLSACSCRSFYPFKLAVLF